MANEIEVKMVGVVRLQPGDVIVYRTAEVLDDGMMHQRWKSLSDFFAGHKVIILCNGDKIEVVRPDAVVEKNGG